MILIYLIKFYPHSVPKSTLTKRTRKLFHSPAGDMYLFIIIALVIEMCYFKGRRRKHKENEWLVCRP